MEISEDRVIREVERVKVGNIYSEVWGVCVIDRNVKIKR